MQIPYVKYLKTKNQDTLLVYFERNTLFFKLVHSLVGHTPKL